MKTNKYNQQVHKNCGGDIVIVASKKDWIFACNVCRESWFLQVAPTLPKDFEDCIKYKNK